MGKEESRETPQDEARSHSSGFLKKAARLATKRKTVKRKTKTRKAHRGTKSRGGRK
jgi:hypothetical protein